MKNDLAQIIVGNPAISRMVSYENATNGDTQGVDYDHIGRVNLAQIKDKAIFPVRIITSAALNRS